MATLKEKIQLLKLFSRINETIAEQEFLFYSAFPQSCQYKVSSERFKREASTLRDIVEDLKSNTATKEVAKKIELLNRDANSYRVIAEQAVMLYRDDPDSPYKYKEYAERREKEAAILEEIAEDLKRMNNND